MNRDFGVNPVNLTKPLLWTNGTTRNTAYRITENGPVLRRPLDLFCSAVDTAPKDRETIVVCLGWGMPSKPIQSSPRNSRTVLSPPTPIPLRILPSGRCARSRAVMMSLRLSFWAYCLPMPQISPTSVDASALSRQRVPVRSRTPSVSPEVFARRFGCGAPYGSLHPVSGPPPLTSHILRENL